MNQLKLGSLFDGSGGFPLAGALNGIEPVWASEVEPYPIAVTTSRFPHMKHLGDVSKVNGAEIEPVDIITFGSPCQDMSVAGKRAGIKHDDHGDEETTRSGLFYEAIRIIKEMRYGTEGRKPTFVVWENVPGAFSSNRGEDFRTVLEELVKVAEPTAVVPDVPQGGWAYADCWRGDGWSLAYRVFDAQHLRTAQRRKRIYLVLCLGDEDGAGKILFERDSLRGHYPQSGKAWERTASPAEGSLDADDREGEVPYTLKIRSGCEGGGKGALVPLDKSATLATNNDQYLFQPLGADPYNGCLTGDTSSTLGVNCGLATGRSAVVSFEPGIASREGGHIYEGVSGTLRANAGDNQMATAYSMEVVDQHILDDQGGASINVRKDGKSPTLRAETHGNVPCTVYAVENHPADSRVNIDESGTVQTLTSRMGTGGGNVPMVMEPFCKSRRAQSADDATTWKHADKANTLNTFDLGETRVNELVVEQGQIAIDRAYFNQGKNALYDPQTYEDGTNPTLVAKGPSAVCHAIGNGQADQTGLHDIPGALNCMHDQQAVLLGDNEYIDTSHADDVVRVDEVVAPLQERDYKGGKLVRTRYIVRRLTPTECARLQGFPDRWGDIDHKDSMTADDFAFWLEVKQTYDRINGRQPKDYTEKQILAWYNKLHNDGAEYKMWGNGIALPCALYVMEGVIDAAEGRLI